MFIFTFGYFVSKIHIWRSRYNLRRSKCCVYVCILKIHLSQLWGRFYYGKSISNKIWDNRPIKKSCRVRRRSTRNWEGAEAKNAPHFRLRYFLAVGPSNKNHFKRLQNTNKHPPWPSLSEHISQLFLISIFNSPGCISNCHTLCLVFVFWWVQNHITEIIMSSAVRLHTN